MLDTIHQMLESCIVFQSHAEPNTKFKHNINSPDLAFHVVSIDMFGPLSTAICGHHYIHIAADHLTKWFKASSAAATAAKNVSFLLNSSSPGMAAPVLFYPTMASTSPLRLWLSFSICLAHVLLLPCHTTQLLTALWNALTVNLYQSSAKWRLEILFTGYNTWMPLSWCTKSAIMC